MENENTAFEIYTGSALPLKTPLSETHQETVIKFCSPELRGKLQTVLSILNSRDSEAADRILASPIIQEFNSSVRKLILTYKDLQYALRSSINSVSHNEKLARFQELRLSVEQKLKALFESDEIFSMALVRQGIYDIRTLTRFNGGDFFKMAKFSFFGTGRSFIARMRGEKRRADTVSEASLEYTASRVVLSEFSEDTKAKCRQSLIQIGVFDRHTLIQNGPTWFKKQKFAKPYPDKETAKATIGAQAFTAFIFGKERINEILEKSASGQLCITIPLLRSLADEIDLPDFAEETKKGYRDAFSSLGVNSAEELKELSMERIRKHVFRTRFFDGKGYGFIGRILERTIYDLKPDGIEEVAEKIDLK